MVHFAEAQCTLRHWVNVKALSYTPPRVAYAGDGPRPCPSPAPPSRWFRPVPLRSRRDGWSEGRQCAFLVKLYLTGSVTAAAKAVGMSRASAYRPREREGAESFEFAWDRVLSLPVWEHVEPAREDLRKVTSATLFARLESAFVKPVVYRKAITAVARESENSTLFRLLRRPGQGLDAAGDGPCER